MQTPSVVAETLGDVTAEPVAVCPFCEQPIFSGDEIVFGLHAACASELDRELAEVRGD